MDVVGVVCIKEFFIGKFVMVECIFRGFLVVEVVEVDSMLFEVVLFGLV